MDIVTRCPCPGEPHPEDTVTMRDKLSLRAGVAMQNLLVEQMSADTPHSQGDATGRIAEGYVLYGVEAWTYVDANGRPVPVTPETITTLLLEDYTVGIPLAEAVAELYPRLVADPLARRGSRSSPTTPTGESTSAPPTTLPRKQSRPSSITTTPTDSTETTSAAPDGASRSSRSLELVGA